MNSIGMASITAHYNLHREDMRRNLLPSRLTGRAVVIDAALTTACWPLCTPNTCPILFRYLTYNDVREVSAPTMQHVDDYGN